ncbi:MAG: aspartate aminotransferase family protein [Chloroflexota bacterium]|nr:aspartate aminotransferase family protein [Chloroflexota bacterium]MDE2839308.1 aspartate aminotransferase family protein [Chloroflexota bacterium]MDE2931337.1 aspartate aminotransferase family protein [Chloroflexota bacterium]
MTSVSEASALQQELLASSRELFPGGSSGLWRLPDEYQIVVTHGRGSRVWDMTGREYIDCILGSGPVVIGHAHPAVVTAVQAQVAQGATYFLLNEPAIRLAEQVVDAVPCAEQIRFVSTGTEATFYAVRIARAYTGRNKVLKFEGALHGGNDYATLSTVPPHTSDYPHGIPDSSGIPTQVQEQVLISEFNNLDLTRDLVHQHGDDLAAIIMEPLQRALNPEPGFLAAVRDLAHEVGALLIFDEIVTCFRLAWGGAQEYYGVEPDLAVLGKALGGGYSQAAVAGPAEIMEVVSSAIRGTPRYVWMGGTFSGNPLSAVAGLATLSVLQEEGSFARLNEIGDNVRAGLEDLGREFGEPLQAIGAGPLLQVFFGEGTLRSYSDCLQTDNDKRIAFAQELLRAGILTNPGEKLYFSLAHTDEDIGEILDIARAALKTVQEQDTAS